MIDNQLFTNSFSSLFMVVRVALNTKTVLLKAVWHFTSVAVGTGT